MQSSLNPREARMRDAPGAHREESDWPTNSPPRFTGMPSWVQFPSMRECEMSGRMLSRRIDELGSGELLASRTMTDGDELQACNTIGERAH